MKLLTFGAVSAGGTMNSPCRSLRRVLSAVLLAASCAVAGAATLRVANQGDVLSMDPHSLNEGLQLDVMSNVYEPLVQRDRNYKLVPGLATEWRQLSPTVWRFQLRKGVQFHDGTPFTADDVVFSIERAKDRASDLQSYVSDITEVRRVDEGTVDFVTAAPFAILPDALFRVAMMSRKWCQENQALRPVDRRKGIENAASFRANGTGPYRLRERVPGFRTTFVRNAAHWARPEGNVDEVIFTPIGNDATRLAALLSGEVDIVDPLPLQDTERVRANPRLAVKQGVELRTVYLGMDQKRDELLYSSVKGRNPFKDRRVRQAFYQAVDIEAIRHVVMHDAARPLGLIIPPPVRGYAADLDHRLPFDPAAARRLLADAGYPDGFEVKMNCPNDRYVNDAAICQAIAANLARVGVKVGLETESKATYFPRVLRRDTSFYLGSWAAATVDAHIVLHTVMATPGPDGRGQWNLGWYSNPRLDELTRQIGSEADDRKRNELIHEALKIHQDDIGHIPLHQQPINWGLRRDMDVVQTPGDGMPWRYIRMGVPAVAAGS
jgi:peptide/nickel transport system substrate-binding protein